MPKVQIERKAIHVTKEKDLLSGGASLLSSQRQS